MTKNNNNKQSNEDSKKSENAQELKKAVEEQKVEAPKEEAKEKTELEVANERIVGLIDTLRRLQADFENYKKRVEKDSSLQREYASASFITKLLPIIDTFEIAIKNSQDAEKFKQGTELIYAELMSTLKNEGLSKIDAKDKQFDPYLHEAMMAVEAKDKKKDTIIEVLQEGYKLKERVLRHSKVKIAR